MEDDQENARRREATLWISALLLGSGGSYLVSLGYPRVAISLVALGVLVGLRLWLGPVTRAVVRPLAWAIYSLALLIISGAWVTAMVRMRDRPPLVTPSLTLTDESFVAGSIVDGIEWEAGNRRYLLSIRNAVESTTADIDVDLRMPDIVVGQRATSLVGVSTATANPLYAFAKKTVAGQPSVPIPKQETNGLHITIAGLRPGGAVDMALITRLSNCDSCGAISYVTRHDYHGVEITDQRIGYRFAVDDAERRTIRILTDAPIRGDMTLWTKVSGYQFTEEDVVAGGSGCIQWDIGP